MFPSDAVNTGKRPTGGSQSVGGGTQELSISISMGAQQHMALVGIRCLELKIRSFLSVLPTVRNEEQILLAPVNQTNLDGHWLSLTAGAQSAQMISTLPKSPLADTTWGSIPFPSCQILSLW